MLTECQPCRKVALRPTRHKMFSLNVGDQRRLHEDNLIFVNGEKWKASRNAWQPFFSVSSISKHAQLMAASADKLVAQLRVAGQEGREVDVWRMAGLMTLDVVGTCAFGVDFKTLDQQPQQQGSTRHLSTPVERLTWAVQTFFELFGLGNAYFPVP